MWEGVASLDFKRFYEAMAIKNTWLIFKEIDMQYRKERPDDEMQVNS